MDWVKLLVIALVVLLLIAFLASVAGQPWLQIPDVAMQYLDTPAESSYGSAARSPLDLTLSFVDEGFSVRFGGATISGLSILKGAASFLILTGGAWFVFRVAQRVLKG